MQSFLPTHKPLRKILSLLTLWVGLLFFSTSCDDTIQKPTLSKGKGIFILNQGNFSWSNASLSLYHPDSMTVQNNVFYLTNDAPLGDVAQSMSILGNKIFIILNASHKIYVMDAESFDYVGKITSLNSPRYLTIVNDTLGFVSDLYATSLQMINPRTFDLTGEIDLGHSSEQMLLRDSFLYVLAWSYDSLLIKINVNTQEITDSLVVGFQPNSMVMDKNRQLWILSDGGYEGIPGGQKHPKLVCVNPDSMQIHKELIFADMSDSPIQLQINSSGETLYFLNKHAYRLPITAVSLPSEPFLVANGRNFYSLGINPLNEEIYLGDALGYVQPGVVYRYSPEGMPIDSFTTGIIPGAIYFDYQP